MCCRELYSEHELLLQGLNELFPVFVLRKTMRFGTCSLRSLGSWRYRHLHPIAGVSNSCGD